jgi:aspartyl-tRNA(Asn)/glutamyl-tRNA(Gln) amidotransferase subunit C
VDTTGVPPTAYGAVEAAPFRPDVVVESVDRDLALREAPRHEDGGFAGPAFVDEG